MKKRVGLFLFSLALATVALVSGPASAQGSRCQKPECFASPGCCVAQECASWCASQGGGAPACSGNGLGGCCYCAAPES
jgi:hypothetical protein